MSFTVPSNGYRLEGASLRNSYQAGRDLSIAITGLDTRVTDQQLQINELTSENNDLTARLARVEALLSILTAAT